MAECRWYIIPIQRCKMEQEGITITNGDLVHNSGPSSRFRGGLHPQHSHACVTGTNSMYYAVSVPAGSDRMYELGLLRLDV